MRFLEWLAEQASRIGRSVAEVFAMLIHPGSAADVESQPDAAKPANTVLPTITGTAQVGVELTATPGTWTGSPAPTFAYQWQAGGTDIAGAMNATYTPVAGDVGKTLAVVVTASNSQGDTSATSAATAAVIAAA